MLQIRLMRDQEAGDVARLHAQTITQGFLARLGPRFVRQVYLGVAHDEGCRVWVAEDDGRVIGWCAYSQDVSAMYRRILRARRWKLVWASLPRSLNPWLVKDIVDTLSYPQKQESKRLPPAEILSIGVDSAVRGGGMGRKLLNAAIEQARAGGQPALKVLAGAKLDAANKFYSSCGFAQVGAVIQHGETLNVYVMKLSEPASA